VLPQYKSEGCRLSQLPWLVCITTTTTIIIITTTASHHHNHHFSVLSFQLQ
jgi:hypothetical protein